MPAFTDILKKGMGIAINRAFNFWQTLGIHVTPNHFYQPIPDSRTLSVQLWNKEKMQGIDIDDNLMNALLEVFMQYKTEYELFPRNRTGKNEYFVNNGSFVSVDSEIYYCMIRHFKPKKIIEIGAGYSTCLAAKAIFKNKEEGFDTELIAIEPFPSDILKGISGLNLIVDKVQNVPASFFKKLGKNDILFIDSSHVLKIGSDVQYEFFEILPELQKEVIIHLHDIFLPSEYPQEWIFNKHIFWNEQYFLKAFLMFNNAFEVLWAGHYMHLMHQEKLEKAFKTYSRSSIGPGSFYIKKCQ